MITARDQKLLTRSYLANSMEEALAEARRELGPDALLLSTREAPPDARQHGEIEVVFGKQSADGVWEDPREADDAASLRAQIREIRAMLLRMRTATGDFGFDSDIERALAGAGIEPAFAAEIADAAYKRASADTVRTIRQQPAPPSPEALLQALREEIDCHFDVKPGLARVTALVGPPGAGKTSTLVKLAVSEGLVRHRLVHFISADEFRIGGAEQLRTFAEILGISFQVAGSPGALANAIEAAPKNALVLIDTPGFSGALRDFGSDLAGFLGSRQDIDTHLVLTASMASAELSQVARQFEAFSPSRLLFTRMDETKRYGSVFYEAARSSRPLSYFGTGQLIPEDLTPASKARIASTLVLELPQVVQAVA